MERIINYMYLGCSHFVQELDLMPVLYTISQVLDYRYVCVEKVNEEVEDLSCSRTINIFVRHDALFFSDIARILKCI